jgi:hypothetical protein
MLQLKTRLDLGLAVLFVLAAAGFSGVARAAQLSPPATAMCQFADGKTITIEYSSPRVRERKIFGGLVPFGRVWILGANEATSFVPTTNVTVGGKSVQAGNYSLFALPQPDAWTLIVNKTPRENIGRMSFYPGEASDLVRVPLTVSKLPATEENFTISFVQKGSACEMRFDWEQTRASVTVQEGKP